MKLGLPDSWLKDGRGVAAGSGLVVGFLIAMLIFGKPWHLPPAWGDVPTWLGALFAGVAGVAALRQLGALRRQLNDEAENNARQDRLISVQLAEAQRRFESDQRVQAEGIEVNWHKIGPERAMIVVTNKSRRPITHISCQLKSNDGSRTLKLPRECGEIIIPNDGRLTFYIPSPKLTGEIDVLRPQAVGGFQFHEISLSEDAVSTQTFVILFNDDAGFRWQLDEHLHLIQFKEGGETKPSSSSKPGTVVLLDIAHAIPHSPRVLPANACASIRGPSPARLPPVHEQETQANA